MKKVLFLLIILDLILVTLPLGTSAQSWKHILSNQSNSPAYIRDFGFLESGNLFVATDIGLVEYDGNTTTVYNTSNGLSSTNISHVEVADDGKLYVLTESRMLHVGTPNQFQSIDLAPQILQPVLAMISEGDSFLYLQTIDSVYSYNVNSNLLNNLGTTSLGTRISRGPGGVYLPRHFTLYRLNNGIQSDSVDLLALGYPFINSLVGNDSILAFSRFGSDTIITTSNGLNFEELGTKLSGRIINLIDTNYILSSGREDWRDFELARYKEGNQDYLTFDELSLTPDNSWFISNEQVTALWGNNIVVPTREGGFLIADRDIDFNRDEVLTVNELSLGIRKNANVCNRGIGRNNEDSTFFVNHYAGKQLLVSSTPLLSAIHEADTLTILNYSGYPSGYTEVNFFSGGPLTTTQNEWMRAGKIYKVNQGEIENHKASYSNPGYQPPRGIRDWPAHGVSTLGQQNCLAPFVDVDEDGVYVWQNGDYPQIRGDEAIYVIANDDHMGVELHAMAYAYSSTASHIAKTTFYNYRVVNVAGQDYTNIKFGFRAEYNLGNGSDDYIGCDTNLNLGYVYNGDDFDEWSGWEQGFELSPPAFGQVFLNSKLEGFSRSNFQYDSEAFIQALVHGQIDTLFGLSLEKGYMLEGDPVTQTGITEAAIGNIPGDRQVIQYTDFDSLPAGASIELDFAYTVADNSGSTAVDAITDLRNQTTQLHTWYANQSFDAWNFGCDSVVNSVPSTAANQTNVTLYPNPVKDAIWLDGLTENETYQIISIAGQEVQNGTTRVDQPVTVSDLHNGLYILRLYSGNVLKFIKE